MQTHIYTHAHADGTSGLPLPLLSSRMFYSRARAYPVAIFSVIKYDAGEEKAKIAKLRAEDQRGLEVFELPQRDWRGMMEKIVVSSIVLQFDVTSLPHFAIMHASLFI